MRATNLLAATITLTFVTMAHAGAIFTGDAAQATAPSATVDGNPRNINVIPTDGQGPRWVNTGIGLRYTGARLEYTALQADVLKTVVIKLSGTRPFNYTAGLYATASRLDGSVGFFGLAGSELADIVDVENISSWQTKGYSSTATVTKTGLDFALEKDDFDTGDVATPLQTVTPGGSDVLVSSITIRYRPQFAGNMMYVLFPSSVDSSTFEVPEPATALMIIPLLTIFRWRAKVRFCRILGFVPTRKSLTAISASAYNHPITGHGIHTSIGNRWPKRRRSPS